MTSNEVRIRRKIKLSIFTAILLSVFLCITSYALYYATVSVEANTFHTGTVKIDLNGGKPVIEENEYLFEPGMTVEKQFYLQNNSTDAVYYRLYFANLEGGLADVLDVTILEGDTVLYKGKPSELIRTAVLPVDKALAKDERKELTIRFYFPTESLNSTQNLELRFDLCADAVQTKNNPDKTFE